MSLVEQQNEITRSKIGGPMEVFQLEDSFYDITKNDKFNNTVCIKKEKRQDNFLDQ